MDFSWSNEQEEFFAAIERFATAELNHNLIDNDRDGVFNSDGWTKCGRMGIQGLAVPLEYGGLGQDPLTTVGALERLGYACRDNGLIFSINAHMWAVCAPLVAFGTEEQKIGYLPRLSSGDLIGANAVSEPGAGSDAYGMRCRATKRGDRYILNGNKTFVSNGPIADVVVVLAATDPEKGSAGLSAFLVERSFKGFSVARTLEKMGLRTSPMAEIFFDDCEVPEENRLGKEGAGASLFMHSMTWERGCILASAVGSMRRLLENSIRYTKERKQFGKPIGEFQLVSSKLVDMKIGLETARYMLYHYAHKLAANGIPMIEAAMAKLHISEAWIKACENAIQIHGGYGYMTEYELERELRDAIGSRMYSGTNEIQRTLIASLLRL
jgi:alkylation response protein AidB-like acyl-CoA dehydrogenase